MNQGQRCWNPYLEKLPREELHRLQLQKFKRIFQWAYTHSRFDRRLYEKAGLTPADITSFEDIRRGPKVDKSMLRNIKGKAPFPYGDALCVPLEEVVPGGVLDTQARILKIREVRPTAMMATPTYVLGMAETARRKR